MGKILIVDDDADAGEALAKFFTKSGHEAAVVANGRFALSYVLDQTPDVVVLDLLMPDMDGPSFLEVVRSYLRLQSLPVVILTGLSDSPMIDRAQALKVNAVLAKAKATGEDVLRAVEEAMVRHPG